MIVIFATELEINFDQLDYSYTEGEPGAHDIRVQFRRTQSPFTLILHPVSHGEAFENFYVDNLIGEILDEERATSGKINHMSTNIIFGFYMRKLYAQITQQACKASYALLGFV